MATGTLTFRYVGPGLTKELVVSKTGTAGAVLIDGETIANSTTDGLIVVNLDVSAVKMFWIQSDQNITLETNSGSAPDDTLNLIAGEPYVWDSTMLDTFKLTADVTGFYFTNSSGATATIYCGAVWDATP